MVAASNAWLLVSDSSAPAGSEVLISAFARSVAGGAVGSFTARFLYDSLQLQLVATDSIGDDAMRAVNPIPGEYRVAGASARGLPLGLLFRFRAKVIDPRGLKRLALVLDELHSVTLADLTAKLEVEDSRAALFSTVPGMRILPEHQTDAEMQLELERGRAAAEAQEEARERVGGDGGERPGEAPGARERALARQQTRGLRARSLTPERKP